MRIERDSIAAYAAALALGGAPSRRDEQPTLATREQLAAFWLGLDAINFGSGWFPTLRKRAGHSGYGTIAAALRDRVERDGPWTAAELTELDPAAVAQVLGQTGRPRADGALRALAQRARGPRRRRVRRFVRGRGRRRTAARPWRSPPSSARGRASADSSRYEELEVPFLKRAQIAAADLSRAGVADLRRPRRG